MVWPAFTRDAAPVNWVALAVFVEVVLVVEVVVVVVGLPAGETASAVLELTLVAEVEALTDSLLVALLAAA